MVQRRQIIKGLLSLPLILNGGILSGFSENKPFSFAQLTDLHLCQTKVDLSRRLFIHSEDLFKEAILTCESKGIKDIILTGDIINTPLGKNWGIFLNFLNRGNLNYYTIPGNHDLSVGGNGVNRDHFRELIQKYRPPLKDKVSYFLNPSPGVHFIFLDGVDDSKITANGRFGHEQIDWLENHLLFHPWVKNSQVFIFSHYPIVEPFSSKSHRVESGEVIRIKNILKEHPSVQAVISGHYHSCRVQQVDSCHHISSPSLVEFPNAFRTFNLYHDRIETEIIQSKNQDWVLKSGARCRSKSLNEGRLSDKKSSIPV